VDFKQINLVGNGLDLRVLKSLYGLLTSRYRRREQEIPAMLELRPASDLGVSRISGKGAGLGGMNGCALTWVLATVAFAGW
jgi:hypothetical protein